NNKSKNVSPNILGRPTQVKSMCDSSAVLKLDRIILGTHREKGAYTFWSYAVGLPLPSSAIVSWKFCHVLHKIMRDGHRNVSMLPFEFRNYLLKSIFNIICIHGYGQLVCLYSKLLCTKMEFHTKHSEIPASLEASDEVLERTAGTDINNVFQLTVEVFDYMDAELRLAEAVLRQLNMSIAISTLTSGQCKLAPLIQVIQDCSHLYHYTVKLLFKLHACLPADTLQGHRERFHEQFHSLKTFLNKARDMIYFKRLIQIPRLPDSPPNFLRASALAEHVKPMVVIPDEEELEEQEEDEPEPLIDVSEAQPSMASQPQVLASDLQIEHLKREIELLKAELEKIKGEAQRYITQLKSQINSLETELEEQRAQKQRTLVENEQLRMELEAIRRRNTEHESMQTNFVEAESKSQATELRYNKLKEKHAELVANHAELLRKSADTVKMLSVTQQTQEEIERTKQQLAFQVERVRQESDMKFEEQRFDMDKLRRELEEKNAEIHKVKSLLQTSEKQLNSSMAALKTEKDRLTQSISKKDADLSSLMKEAHLKEYSLQQERDRTIKELGELQGKLKEKLSHEDQLQQKLLDEQFALLQATVTEAENIIQDAVATLDDPLHINSSSSPDYLISRAEATLNSIDKLQVGHSEYVKRMRDAGSLVRALTKFSHLTADTIISGSATAHMAHTDDADRKSTHLHLHNPTGADPTSIQAAVQKILRIGQDLRPKGIDVGKEELGDVVDKEMAATSAAIEEAVRRIDVSRKGTKLFIRHRKTAGVKPSSSVREFYARNSRWTEGLISASKAVGWGATQMVDSADKVVLHTGKYEELIVCSHEIAASTAQLVAASKVKADRGSKKLGVLQHASRNVNEMAANVVASTKTGQDQIVDKGTMDFSGMSLIKLKKEEMESQVKVLELETMLENERLHLGGLRKKHYEIAASPHVTAAPSSPKPSKPTLMKKPALAQKPNIPPKSTTSDEKLDKFLDL
uniref:Huntingtin-interacting protein 1-related protein-like n=1 Tax=Sinocyclocheilus grahami TaxID=75366 RepID=A0A672NPL8_SINGR